VYKHLAGLSDFDLHQVCNESQLKAGGLLRIEIKHSTDVVLRRTESARMYEHSP
jgi:hypothetical protein